jgi:hypothetical protein
VGYRNGYGRPVGRKPTTKTVRVIASAEVVVAGFGIALFTFEFVDILSTAVGVGLLAAEGGEVGVIADDSGSRGEDTR